jgi:hypothetical protein
MQTKLTLRLDDSLIRKMKRYSAASGKSLSRLVADYFALVDAAQTTAGEALTPRVKSLFGALAHSGVSEADERRHRELKHR